MIGILLNRLFGLGKIPDSERKMLDLEGTRISCEGISGSLTYKNYHALGGYFLFKREWFMSGTLVVTGHRLVAYGYTRRIINLPLAHTGLSRLTVFVEDGRRLCLAGDASDFGHDHSGRLEFRFTIPGAEKVAQLLKDVEA